MSTNNNTIQKKAEKNVEILYQKMGNRWFAFSVVEGEVFMGSITQEEIDALEAREAGEAGDAGSVFGISGNT